MARSGGRDIAGRWPDARKSDAKAPIALGDAVETTAGDTPARWVIHAATMGCPAPLARVIEPPGHGVEHLGEPAQLLALIPRQPLGTTGIHVAPTTLVT